MTKPYTIRLFAPNGNPDDIKVIAKMNWTGVGLEVSRTAWQQHKQRDEFTEAGIYILFGYQEAADGFNTVFLGENAWYAIRIGGGMRGVLKYIAAYQTAPVSAITHVAEIDSIEPYGDGGKYKINFAAPARKIDPITYGNAKQGIMQSPRYARYEKLCSAKTLPDVFDNL